MTDFIVRFSGVKLSREATARLQAAIGGLVESEVSASSAETPNPDDTGGGQCVFLPHKWLGRLVIPAASLERNPAALNETLKVEGSR